MRMTGGDIMLRLWIFLLPGLLSACTPMAGDVVTNLVKLPTGDIVSAATDRFGSWERVQAVKAKARAEIARAKAGRARAEADKASHVTLVLDTPEKISAWGLIQANERLAQVNTALRDVAVALATGKASTDGIIFDPFPEGAFSEFAHTLFGGVADVFNTPTAGLVAGGWALDKIFNGRPPSNQFNGPVNADGSFNNSTLHQTGSTGNPMMQPYGVRPEVVHPEVVHADVVPVPTPAEKE